MYNNTSGFCFLHPANYNEMENVGYFIFHSANLQIRGIKTKTTPEVHTFVNFNGKKKLLSFAIKFSAANLLIRGF